VSEAPLQFSDLGLPETILNAVSALGYEQPSPIQEKAIPPLLAGQDILGQAQTGTGKTAAFALPLLSRIDQNAHYPQALVLAPTRELAIQVAEACQSYAKNMKGFTVLPIYGGQAYGLQLKQLRRGAQLIVGTPGRVMDHMRRGSLKLDKLSTLVLDEADEMLRMGFIDDVNWVLEHTPADRQIALFSATMPKEIKQVAEKHLNEPAIIKIESKSSTASTINQRYWLCQGVHKLDALTRILEAEEYDGIIVFVRTKLATEELAQKLAARGFASAALNGDIPQAAREKTVERLKRGNIDILVATDVVARGLDVERISHVINYDIPYDTEAYVHRIGRTGRAGRSGEAILFVAPREQRMLKAIQKTCKTEIQRMQLPTAKAINAMRIEQFKTKILDTIESSDLTFYQELIEELCAEKHADPIMVAAALAKLQHGERDLLLDPRNDEKMDRQHSYEDGEGKGKTRERRDGRERRFEDKPVKKGPIPPLKAHPEVLLERYRIEVGHRDNVKPGQIVAAIANEADISSEYIGAIEIYDSMTTVDLPEGMPRALLKNLQKTRVANRQIKLRLLSDKESANKEQANTKQKPDRKPRKRQAPNK
jgi:ATP-dependent RNA helicase DeaD